MAVKIKDITKKNETIQKRFNFGSSCQEGDIHDLLEELRTEYQNKNGITITLESLENTLNFINETTGQSINSNKKNISPITLKTIKLLYVKNRESGKNLFRLLSPPGSKNQPTMEFATTTTISRDKKAYEIIASIINELSIEIPKKKIAIHQKILEKSELQSTAECFLTHIVKGNDTVMNILGNHFAENDKMLAYAYQTMTKSLNSLTSTTKNHNNKTPLNESLFVYLDTLALRHFISHRREHMEKTLINIPIASISEESHNLFQKMNVNSNTNHDQFSRVFSANNFHHVILGYKEEISSLIRSATGLTCNYEQLIENTKRAKPLLVAYGFRAHDEIDPNASTISLVDIIAVICSFRYQQEVGTEYIPFWKGQGKQGKDPQRHYDNGFGLSVGQKKKQIVRKNDLHQHQGVFQLYYDRFSKFQAVFKNENESYDAWMAYQSARLSAYEEVIKVNNITKMWKAAEKLDALCIDTARELTANST
jgi:hypothetical protein